MKSYRDLNKSTTLSAFGHNSNNFILGCFNDSQEANTSRIIIKNKLKLNDQSNVK